MIKTFITTCFVISLAIPACQNQQTKPAPPQAIQLIPTWLDNVDQEVHKLGSFNWVIVADPAFPALSRSGVITVTTPVSTSEALYGVLQSIDSHSHVRPRIHLIREASGISEEDTPGINRYRAERDYILNERETVTLTNKALNLLITDARKNYRILVIKTTTMLPYSSIFMELESGYWDGDSETALRKRLSR